MLSLGFMIASWISNSTQETNEKYFTSLKIDNDEPKMQYALKTSVGRSMVYGEITALTPVAFPELSGDYFYAEKHKERYTMHTRVVTTTDGKGHTTSHTETYYTWDSAGSWWVGTQEFEMLGSIYPVSKINLPNAQWLDMNDGTVSEQYKSWASWGYLYENGDFWHSVGDIRYSFYVIPKKFFCTLFIDIKDKTFFGVDSNKAEMFYNMNISESIESVESRGEIEIIIFWIVWGMIIVGSVIALVVARNKWLEDK